MHLKVYESELSATYKTLWHLDLSCSRDKVNRAVGRRAGALFFARHLDNFIMTRNFRLSIGTGKKLGTSTRTPTNQTAGPLAVNRLNSSN